jgi:hypothetical protein
MNKIEKQLESLSELRQKHIDLGKKMVSADDNKVFPVNLFCNTILNRSISLLKYFISQIEDRHFISAAPILRLQHDNLFRLSAICHV